MNGKKFLYLVLVLVVLLNLILYSSIFFFFKTFSSDRIPNIRLLPLEYRLSFVSGLMKNFNKNYEILLIGDSQPNGYLHNDNSIFSFFMKEKCNLNVLNLAFQDGRVEDAVLIAKQLKKEGRKFKYIIFNINPSHVKNSDFGHMSILKSNLYMGIATNPKSFFRVFFEPNPKENTSQNLVLRKYDSDYFKLSISELETYFQKILYLHGIASELSDNFIVYITPHSNESILYQTNSAKLLENKNLFALKAKEYFKGINIKLLELDNEFANSDFIDIVHFNMSGHEKMSRILCKYVNF